MEHVLLGTFTFGAESILKLHFIFLLCCSRIRLYFHSKMLLVDTSFDVA